jgi:hypothetical protein
VWDGTFDGNHNSKLLGNLLDQSADGAELYLDCMIGQTDHQKGGIDDWKTENLINREPYLNTMMFV